MAYRDGIFAIIALTLSSLALAGMLSTEAYSQAAQAEASGVDALTHQVWNADTLLCVNTVLPASLSAASSTAIAQ